MNKLSESWSWSPVVQFASIMLAVNTLVLVPAGFGIRYVFRVEVEKAIESAVDEANRVNSAERRSIMTQNSREHKLVKDAIIELHPEQSGKAYHMLYPNQ